MLALYLLVALWSPTGIEYKAIEVKDMAACQAARVSVNQTIQEQKLNGFAVCIVQGPSV